MEGEVVPSTTPHESDVKKSLVSNLLLADRGPVHRITLESFGIEFSKGNLSQFWTKICLNIDIFRMIIEKAVKYQLYIIG